jgi:hypothetical protein
MAGFANVRELIEEAYTNGKNWYTVFRKVPALASTLGVWFDASFAPGSPRPNYKIGDELTATLFNGAYGIYHGSPVTTDGFKFLHKFMVGCVSANVIPATFLLCDYLLFYPLIDMDNPDYQSFTNTVSLPRYTDGQGVKAYLVATNPYVGGQQFRIRYTNQNGTPDCLSEWVTSNATGNIATLVNSGVGAALRGPFIQLAPGDTGLRSVQGIEMAAPNGGLAALVLVRPIATLAATDVLCVSETDFFLDSPSLPKIYDGAYLNLLCYPNGSANAIPIFGELTTIWR